MRSRIKESVLLALSLGSFAVMAASFLLMAPWPGTEESGVRPLLAGILFWLPLSVGCICQGIINAKRKKWLRYYRRRERQRRCGMFTLCATPLGMAADFLMVFSVIGLGISLWLTHSAGIICYFFLSFFVFSFTTHCIFNGKNYNYIQHIARK